ncbi:hypothetical protein [Novosphingobium sp.]|uniref:hypothetical protein n=1 Tax=Novosphingobium sp. TaxID=1874826 RepID=UPI00286E2AF2|nr:hypothetical protein [Novosphingobium sp.]
MAFSAALALLAAGPATLDAFEAKLAEHDSATVALGEWCAMRQIADPAQITVSDRRQVSSNDPPAKMRRLLGIGSRDSFTMRHVHLDCGGKTLSIAWNWYVPGRMTPEMNAALASTSTPFGKVATPLRFRREAIDTVKGPADNCPAETISTHLARLILPDGKPLAYLVECYTAANLAP